MLAQQAISVGASPAEAIDVLRPGDPFEQLLTAALITSAAHERTQQTHEHTAQAVLTGQTIAFCMGIDPDWVQKVGEILLGGDET